MNDNEQDTDMNDNEQDTYMNDNEQDTYMNDNEYTTIEMRQTYPINKHLHELGDESLHLRSRGSRANKRHWTEFGHTSNNVPHPRLHSHASSK